MDRLGSGEGHVDRTEVSSFPAPPRNAAPVTLMRGCVRRCSSFWRWLGDSVSASDLLSQEDTNGYIAVRSLCFVRQHSVIRSDL